MPSGILYTFRRCPYAIRARMALAVSECDMEVREILLSDKPKSFLDLSPKGTVPVLSVGNGAVLEESLDIMEWALAKNDPEEWLLRRTDRDDRLVESNDGPFKRYLDRYKYATRYQGADSETERSFAVEYLLPLERLLSDSLFLNGEHPSFVDVAIFPFVRQFAGVASDRFAVEFPALQRWRLHWQAAPHFVRIMNKLRVWQEGQPAVSFSAAYGV